jgi:hypothetical protein
MEEKGYDSRSYEDKFDKRRPKSLTLEASADMELRESGSPQNDFPMKSPVPASSSSRLYGELKPFEMDSILKFHPPGAWQSKFGEDDGIPYEYHVSTSFLKPGFNITCPGGVDHIKIVCYGILTFKVLYSKEGEEDKAFGSGVVLSQIEVPPSVNGQRQRVEVKTPWPSMKVEAVVDQQSDDFVAIFGVTAYTSSRPSSLSTPINENKGKGADKPPWERKSMSGINPRML